MSRCVEYYEVILPRQLRQDNSAEGCSHDLISKQSKSEILRYLQLVDTLEDSGISRASAIAYLTEGASRPLLREHDAAKKAAAIAKVAEAIKARIELADVKPRKLTGPEVERILNTGDALKAEPKADAPEAEQPKTEAEEKAEREAGEARIGAALAAELEERKAELGPRAVEFTDDEIGFFFNLLVYQLERHGVDRAYIVGNFPAATVRRIGSFDGKKFEKIQSRLVNGLAEVLKESATNGTTPKLDDEALAAILGLTPKPFGSTGETLPEDKAERDAEIAARCAEPVAAEVITTETEEHAEPLVCPECEERGKAWADAQEAAPEVEATPEPEPEPKPTTKRKSKEAQEADAQNIVDEFKVLLKNARERYSERSYFNALKEIKTIVADELKEARR